MGFANTKINPGNACFIVVDSVNRPEGYWEGEIVSCEECFNPHTKASYGYFDVVAKIKHTDQMDVVPYVNYRVFPKTKDTEYFIDSVKTNRDAYKQLQDTFQKKKKKKNMLIYKLLRLLEKVPKNDYNYSLLCWWSYYFFCSFGS